jgi:hypothetical protein
VVEFGFGVNTDTGGAVQFVLLKCMARVWFRFSLVTQPISGLPAHNYAQ